MFKNLIKLLFPLAYIDGEGGGGNDNWRATLPEDIRAWDEVKNSDTVEKFWGQMTDMRSHIGQSIRIPGPDAGEEDWKTFNEKMLSKVPTLMPKPDASDKDQMDNVYKALGKPEKAEDYTVPEGLTFVKEDVLKSVQERAHSLSLNNAQFAAMAKEIEERLVGQNTTQEQMVEKNVDQLKQQWGAAFDNNYAAILKYLQDTKAPESLQKDAVAKALSPDVATWLIEQHKAVYGEGSQGAGDHSAGDVITPAEAQMQISEILNNKDHAYWNARDPAHRAAMERMLKLQKLKG